MADGLSKMAQEYFREIEVKKQKAFNGYYKNICQYADKCEASKDSECFKEYCKNRGVGCELHAINLEMGALTRR